MKQYTSLMVIFVGLLLSSYSANATMPYFQIRSQARDSARELVGWHQFINRYDHDKIYGALAFTVEGTRSFDPSAIASTLFDSDLVDLNGERVIVISGSQVAHRGANDWLADYFGLPVDYQSTLSFKPRITQAIVNCSFYLGLDEWFNGLYLQFNAPIVHSRWNLHMCETINAPGITGYAPGYMSDILTGVNRSKLVNSFVDYVSNEQVPNLGQDVTFAALTNSKMAQCGKARTGVGDVQMVGGWNFFQSDSYHIGINILGIVPSGLRPYGAYLFEPMIGNGHHWGLGAGLTGHYTAWRSQDENQNVTLFLDATINTLFKAHQRRSFDLKNKPNSRYMLASLMGATVTNLYTTSTPGGADNATPPTLQFQNIMTPVANLTTVDVQSTIGAQADITIMASYVYNNITVDVGYNFWGVTREKLKFLCQCPAPLDGTTWALKGDSLIYGFAIGNGTTIPINAPVALSASESLATIHGGTNGPAPASPNINVDNPAFAQYTATATGFPGTVIVDPPTTGAQVQTSSDPILLINANIDLEAARNKGFSNKVFAHINYTGKEYEGWIPFVGIGGNAEFGHHRDSECGVCGDVFSLALSQWGIWLKTGVAFD